MSQRVDSVLVVDFGAQYAQLIARRVREAHVYSEIVPHTITIDEIVAKKPTAIIFSGGPKSVHAEGAPSIDRAVYDLGVPILGLRVDRERYFWYHHTSADTVDKVAPRDLARCTAAMAVMAYALAEMEEPLPR